MHSGYLLMLPLILVFNFIEAEALTTKAKKGSNKPVELKLNSSYYRQPFRLCKLRRKMNPVEGVRAQAFATRVFSRCGSNIIIKYAEIFKMPAFGLHSTANILCFGARVSFAHVADDETGVLKTKEQVRGVLEIIKIFLGAMLRLRHALRFRLGNMLHTVPSEQFIPFIREAANCAILGTGTVQLDPDYLLHAINYYEFILL